MKLSTILPVWMMTISISLLRSTVATSWIDPRTPTQSVQAMDDRTLQLVFSDEFEDDARSFRDGHDTRWTAEDRPGIANAALQYYNSSHAMTRDGKLVIETSRQDASWIEYDPKTGQEYPFSRFYQSAMVTTWNKFCFTSGMIEISFQLPGKALRGGLWPAFWMLGNLARPSYMDSTNGVWPWSFDECGTSLESMDANEAQRLSNCEYGRGRGSPEIDIVEAQPGDFVLEYWDVDFQDNTSRPYTLKRPLISSSVQVAPGVASYTRPFSPNMPRPDEWYPDVYPMGGPAYGNSSRTPRMINNYWYGQLIHEDPAIWQDGLSCNWNHDEAFYEQQVVMRTEWQAGKDDGYVRFYHDDELIYEVTAEMLRSRAGEADAVPQIPYEAMYLILNTDVSTRWGWNGCDPADPCMSAYGMCSPEGQLTCLDCADPECLRCPETTGWFADFCQDIDKRRPAEYKIDYVRVYQDPNDSAHTLGCDPPGLETTQYIEDNWELYTFNPVINKQPLKQVQHGGDACTTDFDCGNLLAAESSEEWYNDVAQTGPFRQSFCVEGKCVCPPDWTGPACQSPCMDAPCKVQTSHGRLLLSSSWWWPLAVTGLLLSSQ